MHRCRLRSMPNPREAQLRMHPKAEGHPLAAEVIRWRLVPILRGQAAAYVTQRLNAYRDGAHTVTSSARMMNGAAANLDDASIEALAKWIETGESK